MSNNLNNINKKNKKPTICLNMIVKDESHIIENNLIKLTDKIKFDYWVICDTGSSDNTPEIITNFFKRINIPGELLHHKWENFASNRTKALMAAFDKTDLLLIFDADDEIHGDIILPNKVDCDQYNFKFGDINGTCYTRVLLINNRKRFIYLSVLHEFITCIETDKPITGLIDGNYYVVSGRTGARNKNPHKYLDDAKLLEKAHKEALENYDFLFTRYAFYCANSYKDYGDNINAIKWYKITLEQPNWEQEKYMCCLNLCECYKNIEQIENGLYYCIESYKYDNQRVEGIYELINHYTSKNDFKMALIFYKLIKNDYENLYLNDKYKVEEKLFLFKDKYNFLLPYYMIIVYHNLKDYDSGIFMYEIIFRFKFIINNGFYMGNMLFNLQFYFPYIKDKEFIVKANNYLKYIYDFGANLTIFDFLKSYKQFGIDIDYIFPKQLTLIDKYNNKTFSKENTSNCKNIFIYVGPSDIKWNYTYSLNNSLGGSERAVLYLSKYLPKHYNIFICGDVQEETIDNLNFISYNNIPYLISQKPFEIVIISRYLDFFELYKNISFSKLYIWCHDIYLHYNYNNIINNGNEIIYKWFNLIDGMICLTQWQKNEYIKIYPIMKDKIYIINNGIDKNLICNNYFNNNKSNINKIPNTFIFSSCAERGLSILLSLWDKILEIMPDAKLNICTYNEFPKPNNEEEKKMLKIIQKHKSSINHLGKLNQNSLYELMSKTEYCLYPCTWPETSCITALELLAHEVIILHYSIAGLDETMNNCGIIINKNEEIKNLIDIKDDEIKKESLRIKSKKYTFYCSWQDRVNSWNRLFESKNNNGNINIENFENYLNPNSNSNSNFNSNLNPNFNSNLNPNSNSNLNPNSNSNFNSNSNPNSNSNLNPNSNPNFNSNSNFNSNLNPNFNSNLNPNFNSNSFSITNLNPNFNYPNNSNLIINRLRELQNILQNNIPIQHLYFLNYLKEEFNFNPKIIYDIGANVLNWTKIAKQAWNNSEIIAFDVIEEAEILYKEANIKYSISLLGLDDDNDVKFYYNDFHPNGNSYYREIGSPLSSEFFPENKFKILKTNKLKTIVIKNNFEYPDLIKLNVQGAELDIIKGSLEIINKAKFIILKLQNIEYNFKAPLEGEVINFLVSNGWKIIAPKFCLSGPTSDYCFQNTNM